MGFDPCAGVSRKYLNGSGELVARMDPAVGPGWRDGEASRALCITGHVGRGCSRFLINESVRMARNYLRIAGNVGIARNYLRINGNFGRTCRYFRDAGRLGRAFDFRLSLAIASLHNPMILTQRVQAGLNSAPDNTLTDKEDNLLSTRRIGMTA